MDTMDVLIMSLCLVTVNTASVGQILQAAVGKNVFLTCKAGRFMPFEVVDWSRADGNSEYVIVYAGRNSDPEIPKQEYKGRVEMKVDNKGDVTLVLKNVTVKDSGTYKCYALKQSDRRKRNIVVREPVNIFHLNVAPGHGHIGLIVVTALMVTALMGAAVLALKKKRNDSTLPLSDEAAETLPV